jgi:tRNA-splicing ligase RtcB
VLAEGSPYLVRTMGYGLEADLAHTESGGCLPGADPAKLSQRAGDRGRDPLGTMGSGNHFVEVQEVEAILDPEAAEAMGLVQGQVTVLIHTGSRGLGHQVCTDYVRLMNSRLADYGTSLPDRQLSCAPASSQEGRDYLAGMAGAANFAWCNRQLIAYRVWAAITRLFPGVRPEDVRAIYDVAHNIAKIEEHGGERLCAHRKGAPRAFGPGTRSCRPNTAPLGSRCSFRAAWARRPTYWPVWPPPRNAPGGAPATERGARSPGRPRRSR